MSAEGIAAFFSPPRTLLCCGDNVLDMGHCTLSGRRQCVNVISQCLQQQLSQCSSSSPSVDVKRRCFLVSSSGCGFVPGRPSGHEEGFSFFHASVTAYEKLRTGASRKVPCRRACSSILVGCGFPFLSALHRGK